MGKKYGRLICTEASFLFLSDLKLQAAYLKKRYHSEGAFANIPMLDMVTPSKCLKFIFRKAGR